MLRPSAIAAGSLAFLGPPHAPELTRYVYVRVRSVDRHAATVVVVGPDVDDTESLEVPLASMRYRIVDEAEAALWPGAYVSVPVAFVQPKGQDAGLWAYGVVVSYRAGIDGPMLDVLHDQEMVAFPLQNDDRIIKVDYLNFALRVDQGASVSATNPSELLAKQNSIIAACAKRRGSLPASVLELLNQPINDQDVVTLVRPSTLERVRVRRQHIINVSLQSSKKRAGSMFDDPDVPSHSRSVVNPAPASMDVAPPVSRLDACLDDDGSSSDASFRHEEMAAVQQQNVTLGKRRRRLSSSSSSTSPSVAFLDERPRQASKGLFQPSTTSRRANGLVVHSRHQGKDPHSLLELIQRSGHVVLFLAVPPVLRALFEFAFGDRGLDVMHCKRATMADKVLAKEKGINMMDFSDKNILRAPGKARSRSDVADALRVLAVFARFFYNSHVNELIATAAAFVDAYTGIEENDEIGWSHIAFWSSDKFGKYSALLVCGEESAALSVLSEFTRYDEGLAQLNDLRLRQRSSPPTNHTRPAGDASRRVDRPQRAPTLPASVVANLPRQGNRRACLKHLSKDGCTGNGSGGCFDPKRAHFIPKVGELRADAKAIIEERYNGLSAAAADI